MMHPAITIQERLTLRNFVLMVWKSQIAPPYRKKKGKKKEKKPQLFQRLNPIIVALRNFVLMARQSQIDAPLNMKCSLYT